MDSHDNGRLKFMAISEREPMGKPLIECERVPVYLRFYLSEDIATATKSLSDLRAERIRRLTLDAVDQGGVLTMEDLAILLTSSLSTVVRDIRKLRKEGEIIPTRGQVKDIGRSIEMRVKIVSMYLEGKTPEWIAGETKRTLEDVMRPIDKYKQIVELSEKRMPSEKIVQLTKVSPRLLQVFLDLREKHTS